MRIDVLFRIPAASVFCILEKSVAWRDTLEVSIAEMRGEWGQKNEWDRVWNVKYVSSKKAERRGNLQKYVKRINAQCNVKCECLNACIHKH